jgi:hypothetical protein
MRRWILPADLARLRVELREPPLCLIRRIEDVGQRFLATEEKPSRRRNLDIPLDLESTIKGKLHYGNVRRPSSLPLPSSPADSCPTVARTSQLPRDQHKRNCLAPL